MQLHGSESISQLQRLFSCLLSFANLSFQLQGIRQYPHCTAVLIAQQRRSPLQALEIFSARCASELNLGSISARSCVIGSMQSLRPACSFSHALAACSTRPVAFRALKHNTNLFPGDYSSKHARALLGQGLVGLLLRVVVCRKLQFCNRSEQHSAPHL